MAINQLQESTFVDRLNEAEETLSALLKYAENLADRLVGYADEGSMAEMNATSSPGILNSVEEQARRMTRKLNDVQASLARISRSLPPDYTKETAVQGKF